MINFFNFDDHPSDSRYLVFRFYQKEQGDFFENLLKQDNHFFERETEVVSDEKTVYYFVCKKSDAKQVQKLNNIIIGKFRKSFIADPVARWVILLVGALFLGLAIVGFIVS